MATFLCTITRNQLRTLQFLFLEKFSLIVRFASVCACYTNGRRNGIRKPTDNPAPIGNVDIRWEDQFSNSNNSDIAFSLADVHEQVA